MYVIFALKRDKNHIVSQMAHAKKIYKIPWNLVQLTLGRYDY